MNISQRSSPCRLPLVVPAVSMVIGGVAPAAIIARTYSLSNYSGDQDGGAALLSGHVTIQFDSDAGVGGGVESLGNGGYYLQPAAAAIIAWAFTVDKSSSFPPPGPSIPPPSGIYTVASTEAGITTAQNGTIASYPDSLRLVDGSLRLEKTESVVLQTSLYWGKSDGGGTGIYFSNYLSNDVHGWNTVAPSNVIAAQWEIGTTIPEPSTVLLTVSGSLFVLLRRKRMVK